MGTMRHWITGDFCRRDLTAALEKLSRRISGLPITVLLFFVNEMRMFHAFADA